MTALHGETSDVSTTPKKACCAGSLRGGAARGARRRDHPPVRGAGAGGPGRDRRYPGLLGFGAGADGALGALQVAILAVIFCTVDLHFVNFGCGWCFWDQFMFLESVHILIRCDI